MPVMLLNDAAQIEPVTVMLMRLPDHVRARAIRAATVADTLARQGSSDKMFLHSLWLGCLYRHLGATLGKSRSKMERIVRECLSHEKCHKDIVLDIVRNNKRKNGSLPARLVDFACTLDEMLTQEGKDFDIHTAGYDDDVMECFRQAQEQIFGLYRRKNIA